MNIAIMIPSLGGGGAERVAQRIGDYYSEHGNSVYYFTGDFGIKKNYDVKGKIVNTHISPIDESLKYGTIIAVLNMIKSIVRLRRLKRLYKIDVSISFMEEFNYLNILSKVEDLVVIRVCTILSERPELQGVLYRKNWLSRVYSRADRIVVMSSFGAKELDEVYGIDRGKISIIPNMAPTPMLQNEDNMIWEYGKKAIVYAGRLEVVKQPDRIIRAFSLVATKFEDSRLLIIGKGPLEYYLKNLCKLYGLGNQVLFLGFQNKIDFYFRNARAIVLASKVEGFPNVLVEAMNYGVPVVATYSLGGVEDILSNGKYGVMTHQMSDKRIAPRADLTEEEISLGKAICSVISDDNVYKDLRNKSLQRAKDYSKDKIMENWNQLIGMK